jgi:hypothetical protein
MATGSIPAAGRAFQLPEKEGVRLISQRLCKQYLMTPHVAQELFNITLFAPITLSGLLPKEVKPEMDGLPGGVITSQNREFVKTVVAAIAVYQKQRQQESDKEEELRLFNAIISASPVDETPQERELRHQEMQAQRTELSQRIEEAHAESAQSRKKVLEAFNAVKITSSSMRLCSCRPCQTILNEI